MRFIRYNLSLILTILIVSKLVSTGSIKSTSANPITGEGHSSKDDHDTDLDGSLGLLFLGNYYLGYLYI